MRALGEIERGHELIAPGPLRNGATNKILENGWWAVNLLVAPAQVGRSFVAPMLRAGSMDGGAPVRQATQNLNWRLPTPV